MKRLDYNRKNFAPVKIGNSIPIPELTREELDAQLLEMSNYYSLLSSFECESESTESESSEAESSEINQ